MKFQELKVDRLKRELNKLELPTTGNKAELQRRLLEEFQQRGINIDAYEFDDEEEMEVCEPAKTSGADMSSLLAAIMQKMAEAEERSRAQNQALMAKVEETTRAQNQAEERSRAQNQALLAEVKETSKAQNQALMAKVEETSRAQTQSLLAEAEERSKAQNQALLAKVEETSRAQNQALLAEVRETSREVKATNEKLEVMSTTFAKRVEGIEARMADLETTVDERINEIEEKVNSLQCQQAGPMRVVPEFASKIKTPCFDGSTPFSVFKLQFETVANRNGWDNEEKALELILCLKGTAAEVLQAMTAGSRNNYEELMMALQRKFGDEHKRDLYQMELRCRAQKANESLQAFAMEIERLVQLTYPGENHPLVDRFKTEAFVSGIRDPELKLAVCATQKTTFAETVAFALAQETARVISRPQVHKVRTMEVESENQHTLNDFLAKMEKLVDKLEQKANVKCYNCGKSGHFQRNCKAPRKRARSISPARNRKGANHKPSSQESPLN